MTYSRMMMLNVNLVLDNILIHSKIRLSIKLRNLRGFNSLVQLLRDLLIEISIIKMNQKLDLDHIM